MDLTFSLKPLTRYYFLRFEVSKNKFFGSFFIKKWFFGIEEYFYFQEDQLKKLKKWTFLIDLLESGLTFAFLKQAESTYLPIFFGTLILSLFSFKVFLNFILCKINYLNILFIFGYSKSLAFLYTSFATLMVASSLVKYMHAQQGASLWLFVLAYFYLFYFTFILVAWCNTWSNFFFFFCILKLFNVGWNLVWFCLLFPKFFVFFCFFLGFFSF